jgi:CheY-like chemotaxis protein
MSEISLLLVEDNDDDRFLTMRVLRKLPFPVRIETARNGDEALRIITTAAEASGQLPTVVMLDLQMPKIGGLSLLARIREFFSQEALPAIVLSSSDNPGDIAACREMGITAYLAKPPELLKLQEALGSIRG